MSHDISHLSIAEQLRYNIGHVLKPIDVEDLRDIASNNSMQR